MLMVISFLVAGGTPALRSLLVAGGTAALRFFLLLYRLLESVEPALQHGEHVQDRVRQLLVVQVDRAYPLPLADGNPSGHPHHGAVRRYVRDDHGPRPDLGVLAAVDGPEDPAPQAMTTPSSMVGCRLPFCFPVPPSVTPWNRVTLSPISVVSPITKPMPWSMQNP